jgi:hypothetical protein
MDQILDKLDKILEAKFPDKKIRDEILATSGEIILWETVNETLERIPKETDKDHLANLIKAGEIFDAFDFAKSKGVKMEDIFEERSKSVVMDLFS